MNRYDSEGYDSDGMGAAAWGVGIIATVASIGLTIAWGWEVAAVCAAVFGVLLLAAGRGERS